MFLVAALISLVVYTAGCEALPAPDPSAGDPITIIDTLTGGKLSTTVAGASGIINLVLGINQLFLKRKENRLGKIVGWLESNPDTPSVKAQLLALQPGQITYKDIKLVEKHISKNLPEI